MGRTLEMDMNKLEDKLTKNSDDISKLAVQMAQLAEITKSSERRHDETMDIMKETSKQIQTLTERVSSIVGIEKDISSLKEDVAELKGDVRVNKHDINNVKNSIQAIVPMSADIASFKTWKEQIVGGAKAGKAIMAVIWLLCGGLIVGLFNFLLQMYMTHGAVVQ